MKRIFPRRAFASFPPYQYAMRQSVSSGSGGRGSLLAGQKMFAPVRVCPEICRQGVGFLHGVAPRQRPALRRIGSLQNFPVPYHEPDGKRIAQARQTAQEQRQLIRRDPGIDNGAPDRKSSLRQKACQACAAELAAVGRVQTGDAAALQPVCDLVHRFLHGNKVLARSAVAVIDDLQHMELLRQQCHRIGERSVRLCRARQKQQRSFPLFSVFQDPHTLTAGFYFRASMHSQSFSFLWISMSWKPACSSAACSCTSR